MYDTRRMTRLAPWLAMLALVLFSVGCSRIRALMPSPTATLPAVSATRVAAPSAPAHAYATNFPAAENPIYENGKWINGGTSGLDWTDVATTPGKAFGTQSGTSPNPYDDSIAHLSGTWGSDQAAIATVFVTSAPTRCCAEVEVHLRRTIAPHSSTGYEFQCSVAQGNPYMYIVRWPGPSEPNLDAYVAIAERTDMGCANGDVLAASAVGSTLTLYKNGAVAISGTDATYASGAPGVGFFVQNGSGNIADWGFSNFAADDSGALPDLETQTADN
jgi:hypothetical protein